MPTNSEKKYQRLRFHVATDRTVSVTVHGKQLTIEKNQHVVVSWAWALKLLFMHGAQVARIEDAPVEKAGGDVLPFVTRAKCC